MQPNVELALLAALAAVCSGAGFFVVRRSRRSPAERERRRRMTIGRRGRLIDGLITELRDGTVYYRYSWRGIDYDTSQDLRPLSSMLPSEADTLIGPVSVKFLSANPYNSIVLSENWSGFPKHKVRMPAVERK